MVAQAYKLHMLQAQRKAKQARHDVGLFQEYVKNIRGQAEYNPDWHVPPSILDPACPFPGVPYNHDSGIYGLLS